MIHVIHASFSLLFSPGRDVHSIDVSKVSVDLRANKCKRLMCTSAKTLDRECTGKTQCLFNGGNV